MDFSNLKYFTIYDDGKKMTVALLKNLWRKIALKTHPDKGGNEDDYKEAQNEYDMLLKCVKAGFTAMQDSPEAYSSFTDFLAHISPIVHDCMKAVVAIPGIKVIEITGYWVWVTLDKSQLTERAALKEINIDGKKFWWRRDHKKWVWRGVAARSRRSYTWQEKKDWWGYDKYEKPEEEKEKYLQIA